MTAKDIDTYFEQARYCKEKIKNIAENHEDIQSEEQAYDYDEIKESLAGAKCESADVLYLKKHLYFIEFKTGFASKKTDVNIKTHKENLKLKIRLKAYESLALFEKVILPQIQDGKLNEKVQKVYIAVVDEEKHPMEAYSDVLKEKSGQEADLFKHEIFKNSLLIYGKEIKNGKKLFYDRVDVWYDFEFDEKIAKLA